jgi:hypothetical protein
MIDEATLSLITQENAGNYAQALTREDISRLIPRLDSAEDKIRYPAFLLLRARSAVESDVYPFWQLLDEKLTSENSYQRSLGAMLIAANARHDSAGNMHATLPRFLTLLSDPKPITVRQCAQALPEILRAKPELAQQVAEAIMQVDLLSYKDTMRKLILVDFLEALLLARSIRASESIDQYLFSALSGSILDEKAKKQIRIRML